MALSEKLVEKLVCPTCKTSLTYEKEKELLICGECQVAYRVTNNVPVLLADEAEKL